MQGKISKRTVDQLEPGQSLADKEVRGFIARRLRTSTAVYGFRYRDRTRRQRWVSIGVHGRITAEQARVEAKRLAGEVAHHRDPVAEKIAERVIERNTVNQVLDEFLMRQIRGRLRSAHQMERNFDRLVRPVLGARSIYSLKRRDLVALFDEVEDNSGSPTADVLLANLRQAFNWWATRDEDFSTPLIKGMRRTSKAQRARDRILNDDEIRSLWSALDEAPDEVARFVKTLLLTGQRRVEVARLHAREVAGNVWTIPAERYKTGRDHEVPLTTQVQVLMGGGYAFSRDGGRTCVSSFGRMKMAIDAKLAGVAHWTLHDLRRTARSLMSRAGVQSDIAERVLGHALGGVRETYDRHDYLAEKTDALERLAGLVEKILEPGANVVQLRR